jgi:hypothetical protein
MLDFPSDHTAAESPSAPPPVQPARTGGLYAHATHRPDHSSTSNSGGASRWRSARRPVSLAGLVRRSSSLCAARASRRSHSPADSFATSSRALHDEGRRPTPLPPPRSPPRFGPPRRPTAPKLPQDTPPRVHHDPSTSPNQGPLSPPPGHPLGCVVCGRVVGADDRAPLAVDSAAVARLWRKLAGLRGGVAGCGRGAAVLWCPAARSGEGRSRRAVAGGGAVARASWCCSAARPCPCRRRMSRRGSCPDE